MGMTVQEYRPEWARSQRIDWQDKAACKNNSEAEYAFMHAGFKVRQQAIKTFCWEACPVREECAQFGKESSSEGVWGGKHIKSVRSTSTSESLDSAREAAASMYKEGISIMKISKIMRRSDRTVKRLISESGVSFRSNITNSEV
jgi:transcription factor WhiB